MVVDDYMVNNWWWIIIVISTIIGLIIAILSAVIKISRWTGNVDSDRKRFGKFMEEIRNDIKDIFKRLPAEPLEKTSSPIALTDYGKRISESIDASEIADMQVTEVSGVVKDYNAYQIQEYCFSFCKDDLLNKLKESHIDLYDKIHKVAFEEGIDVEKITRVIALELRNKILSTLNKNHAEIDQHSPD